MDDPLRSLIIPIIVLNEHATPKPRGTKDKTYALIKTGKHLTLPLLIHNYTEQAFFSSNKNDTTKLTLACRSLITDTNGKVVSRSFSKFFNYHETLAYRPTGTEYAMSIEEKVDGSIINLFFYDKEWRMASRGSFESTHTQAAWKIFNNAYPGALRKLDVEKTYVFELVDPLQPIRVRYTKPDMVLLSIIAKDGSEPPYSFDWGSLPFSRPSPYTPPPGTAFDPKKLGKLNWENKEGFVVKFWRTEEDRYPQRVKVKFESYLSGGLVAPKSKVAQQESLTPRTAPTTPFNPPTTIKFTEPPTYKRLLEIYTSHRLQYSTWSHSIYPQLTSAKTSLLSSLEESAFTDDMGGDAYLALISSTWDRVHALFELYADDWQDTLKTLQKERFKPRAGHRRPEFDRRIRRNDVDVMWVDALGEWYNGATFRDLFAEVARAIEGEVKGQVGREEVIRVADL